MITNVSMIVDDVISYHAKDNSCIVIRDVNYIL